LKRPFAIAAFDVDFQRFKPREASKGSVGALSTAIHSLSAKAPRGHGNCPFWDIPICDINIDISYNSRD
jgi:hypothetical protein